MSVACDPKAFCLSRIHAELARAKRVSAMLSDPGDREKIQAYIQELIAETEQMQRGGAWVKR